MFNSSLSEDITSLSIWCLTRICRSAEVASGFIKHNLVRLLLQKGLKGSRPTARISAWCLGSLVHTDAHADLLADLGVVPPLVDYLRQCTNSVYATPDDISAALFSVARMARSIKLSKALAKLGVIELIAHHLTTAESPDVLLWSARAVGCMMRPNSSDIAKLLLDAGIARGLARLPSVLPPEHVEPLESFAFAIQRFSCAEWGGGTRKSLVDAGVVDSLLAAIRTASDEPFPRVHIELAYAISLLGDVGGSSIRKEIVSAGGIDILKRVGAAGGSEVANACNIAATSITGNVLSRNAASAKTAMAHNWTGGCPDYQPPCPLDLTEFHGS